MTDLDIRRRNSLYLEYIKAMTPDEIMLYGTIHVPRVVKCIGNKYYLLPTYVNNYNIVLLDNTIDGKILKSMNMGQDVLPEVVDELKDWYSNDYPMKRVYFMKYLDTDLFLTKDEVRNHIINNNTEDRSPLFGLCNHAIFINYKDACNHREKFSKDINSKLVIV